MKPNDMNGLWDDSHLTRSPMTPKQAYELLKDLEAELDNTMLMSPDPHEGPEAIEAHDTEVTRLRKAIASYRDGIASEYDDPTKPF